MKNQSRSTRIGFRANLHYIRYFCFVAKLIYVQNLQGGQVSESAFFNVGYFVVIQKQMAQLGQLGECSFVNGDHFILSQVPENKKKIRKQRINA